MTIQFVDNLPDGSGKRGRWAELAQQLQENPGKWAIVPWAINMKTTSIYTSAKRNGLEACRRDGAVYVRSPR